jgi:hypothetical protein
MFPSPYGLTLLASLVVAPSHASMSKNPAIQQVLGSCPFIGSKAYNLDQFCYYNCGGQRVVVTVHFPNQCPLSVDP